MASVCINKLNISPENFPAFSSLTCNTPRRSLSGEMPDVKPTDLSEEEPDVDASDIVDFEFSFSDPVNVIPADELFADGKLFPVTNSVNSVTPVVKSETRRIINGVSAVDSFLYSPKAPKCSSRWKELLGLKKLYHNAKTTTSGNCNGNGNGNVATRSIKQFLNRNSKSPSTDSSSSVNLPLLNDTDNELLTPSSSSRLSHSSSSSDEIHRLSLDSDKPAKQNLNSNLNSNSNPTIRPPMRTVKTRTLSSDGSGSGTGSMRLVSIDSPRMNSSGKIVFHCLERSSSSPSTFNGGSRIKTRGPMERSHSATVRFTPVLNVPVPVCSIRGSKFSSNSNNGGSNKSKQINSKSKSDRS